MHPTITAAATATATAARNLDEVMQSRPLVSTLRNLDLYDDNARFVEALVADIDRAEHHVGAWMFSWQSEGGGTAIRDALLRARSRGVDVDVVVDGLASRQLPFSSGKKFLGALEEAGATVQRAWPIHRDGMRLRYAGHDHMKLFEIDGRTAWTGGRNLAAKYDDWHDYMVRFEGQAAAVLGAEHAARVVELGGSVSPRRMDQLRTAWRMQAGAHGREAVQLLRTDPLHGRTEARDALFSRLRRARDEVLITTPYFGSDETAELLSTAAARGARATVGVPGPNQWKNGQYAIHATRSYYPALEGVRVLEYPFMSHAKANVIDGAAMVGTVNVGKRALMLDQELMLSFGPQSRAAQRIADQVRTDLAKASTPPSGAGDAFVARMLRAARRLTGIEQ